MSQGMRVFDLEQPRTAGGVTDGGSRTVPGAVAHPEVPEGF